VLTRLAAVLALGVAIALRLRDVDATMMLADGVGPYLAATASPFNLHPHAPPYGWALYPPVALCLALASSLRQAVQGVALLHAAAAPLAALSAGRLGGPATALVAGLVVALDHGLADTASSGAEGYLAPVWIGVMTWALLTSEDRPRRVFLAPLAWAAAVMNHPLALCAAPLLVLGRGRRWRVLGGVLALVALAPPAAGWWQAGGTGLGPGSPLHALPTWLSQGGPGAGLLAVSVVLGLGVRRTRPLAVAVLASGLLLGLAGTGLGYLRDHHLRLLTVPAAACLACFGSRWIWLTLVCLRLPTTRVPPPDKPPRPGTLGLATELTDALATLPPPLVVDGAWASGTAAAEPSTVMLDLSLRGVPIGPGGTLAVIVSYDRGRRPAWEDPWRVGDRHYVVTEDHEELAATLCGQARLGGAWDGLAVLREGATLAEAGAWRSGCDRP